MLSFSGTVLCAVCLLSFTTGLDQSEYKAARFCPSMWLNRYEFTMVTLEMRTFNLKRSETTKSEHASPKSEVPSAGVHSAIEKISFVAFGKSFEAKLIPDSPLQFTNPSELNFQKHSEKERFYRGIVYKPCCSTKSIVMETNEGINGMIMVNGETYIIEPAIATKHDASTVNVNSQFINQTSGIFNYRCIVYRASDIKEDDISNKTLIDSVLYSQYKTTYEETYIETLRKKRSIGQTECTLHLVADHAFYEKVGGSDYMKTVAEMKYFVAGADLIFRGMDFNGDGIGDNVGFHIANITVYYPNDQYKMLHDTDVLNYLESFSKYNFNGYCLGVAFTGKQFADGVIGLAYVASSSPYGSAGGICQHKLYYSSEYLSLNTALVTPFNAGEHLPAYKTMLTLTHEFGHSFGSSHDESANKVCAPGNEYGNYLMYPYANDGSKPNHIVFSQCSLDAIYPVIKNKGSCFKAKQGAVCGNGITEDGEDCDCGSSASCHYVDKCCTPSDVSSSDPDTPCTFRKSHGKVCSPKEALCCMDNCTVMPASSEHVCKAAMDCILESKCDGINAECSKNSFKDDGELCDMDRKTCKSGLCIGSVCDVLNGTTCSCAEPHLCHVCCVTNETTCSSAVSKTGGFVQKSPGESCGNMNGFCNGGECILHDPESTINRLADMFTEEGINDVATWINNYWYYIVAALVIFGFLAALFVAMCRGEGSVHTSAYMYGQFARIQREAAIQKEYLEKRRQTLINSTGDHIENVDGSANEMCLTTAIARLTLFFPTVPQNVLEQTLSMCVSEEVAVKMLVVRGYPFRRVCAPEY